jgi:hypothetical protein
MGIAAYRILRRGDGWSVQQGNDVTDPYATREAAFEAALGPASNAIKAGDEVKIEVDAPRKDEPALG